MATFHRNHRSRIFRPSRSSKTVLGKNPASCSPSIRLFLLPLVALLLVTCANCLSFATSCDEAFAARENSSTNRHGGRRRLQEDDADYPPPDDSSVQHLGDALGGHGDGFGDGSLGGRYHQRQERVSPGDAGDGVANESGDEWSPDDGVASSPGDAAKIPKPVFNKTHLFDTGGCNWKAKFAYPKDAPVVSHQTVVNLMVARSDQRSYHQVIERLPLLHVLRKMTKNPALKDAHVALPSSRGLRRMLTSILDFDLPWTPFPFHTPNTLLFAESLIQPLSEHCDEPQHSVWRDIRTSLFEPDRPYHPRASSIASPRTSLSLPSVIQSHHLFLQASSQAIHDAKSAQNPGSMEKLSVSYPTPFLAGVLPMLDVDLGEDEVAWAALPSDWMVVVGLQGLHNRADAEAIRNVVLQHFPAHRVASYCPSMSVEELRNLFSRTALFITVTDSTLMHTIFMRPATLVLELRHPSALRFPSYSLSSVLRLQHYISVCSTSPSFGGEEPDVDPAMAAVSGGGAEGENSPLFCDLDHVKEVVDRAAQFVYLSEAAYMESIKSLGKCDYKEDVASVGMGEERAPVLPAADAIILNRGPHYREDNDFEPHLRTTLLYLRNRFPDKLLIYRNSAGGHVDCPKHHKPIETPQDPSKLPFNWDKFPHQNRLSQPMAEQLGMAMMDVERMTALRPDGHTGLLTKLDCLHYCMPGPLDAWVQVLSNMLEKLLAPRRLRD
ncbi:unnamed protein product [Closterium sp. Yama58-4]|nr:unnamed protein product [Closterium sp. Yama58-4]